MRTLSLTLLLLAAAALPSTPRAAAQDVPRCHQVRPGCVQCTETQIEGRRPRAWFLLARSRSDWRPPPLRRSDLPSEVVESVRRRPF